MTIHENSVRRLLESDEPNYAAVARMGPEVVPILTRLVAGPNARLAAAAASAAGMVPHPRAADALARAAQSASAVVRLAAAGAARNLQGAGVNRVLHTLLADADQGVRKYAIKAAVARPHDAALVARVRNIHSSDPAPANRSLAQRALAFAERRRSGGGGGSNIA